MSHGREREIPNDPTLSPATPTIFREGEHGHAGVVAVVTRYRKGPHTVSDPLKISRAKTTPRRRLNFVLEQLRTYAFSFSPLRNRKLGFSPALGHILSHRATLHTRHLRSGENEDGETEIKQEREKNKLFERK